MRPRQWTIQPESSERKLKDPNENSFKSRKSNIHKTQREREIIENRSKEKFENKRTYKGTNPKKLKQNPKFDCNDQNWPNGTDTDMFIYLNIHKSVSR